MADIVIVPSDGLTLQQWVVREAAALQLAADTLWWSLDELMPKEKFDALLADYNAVCDTMDELETNPEQLFNKALTSR